MGEMVGICWLFKGRGDRVVVSFFTRLLKAPFPFAKRAKAYIIISVVSDRDVPRVVKLVRHAILLLDVTAL